MDQKIMHFSHVHPLLLKEQEHDVIQSCSGCEKPISSSSPVFCCNQCNYVLHKSCALLPLEMKHPLHPQHPLTLFSTAPYSSRAYICNACRGRFTGFVYHCPSCQFDLDITCASPSLTEMDQRIMHFSHVHPLLLKEEHDVIQSCSGCEKPISSGPVFCCNQCNYVLHKSCTQLPREMKHPLHPQHPLTLFSAAPYSSRAYICNACRGRFNGFVYHCPSCKFDLDIACASPSLLPGDGHRHVFISFNIDRPFVCYACGEEGSCGHISSCSLCRIWVHPSCADLPQTIRTNRHHHPLKLTYSLGHEYGFSDDITCGACNGKMSSCFGGYFCSACKFSIHWKCLEDQPRELGTETQDIEDQQDETRVSDYEGSHEGSSKTEQDHDHQNPQEDLGISMFNHEHLLRLMEELSLRCADKLCDACVQPITTPPVFSCSENNCSFLLHQSCAELPRTKQHKLHPHPLTLLPKAHPYDGIYRCDGCKLLSNGFVYRCDECQFDLDVFCGSLVDKIQHESHKHTLLLERTSIARECKGCSLRSKLVFVCDVCDDFALDFGCATLPSKAWHLHDKHPLSLVFFAEGDLREYKCGICKEKRSQKNWFYYCEDCDFGGHPCCVLDDKSRRVKFGGTFQYDVHSHSLALVEQVRKHPPCEACGEGCNGWALECGQCKCHFHREGQCFWEQFKESAKYLALPGMMRHKYAANVFAATPNVTNK